MQKDWDQGTVTVDDGIELFYTRTGKGDKPTILLAHGLTHSGQTWQPFASDLESDYNLIMYDAYGHGQSSRVDPDKRFNLTEDLHDLIEALDLEKPAVIGHSMGALTAAKFAVAYPDMLSALVLEDPPWSDKALSQDQLKTNMQEMKKQNLADKKKTFKELIKQKKKESPEWQEAIVKAWAQAILDFDPTFFDHYPHHRDKWRNQAKEIAIPTLIVTGDVERGAIVSPKIGVEAVQLLDQGEFGHISTAGHCVRYQQYQPYLTMVKLFLKRNVPA